MTENSFIKNRTVSSRWQDIELSTDTIKDDRGDRANNDRGDRANNDRGDRANNDRGDGGRNENTYIRQSYPGGGFMAFTTPPPPPPPKVFDLDKMKNEFPSLNE
jgi:hypothetical protein